MHRLARRALSLGLLATAACGGPSVDVDDPTKEQGLVVGEIDGEPVCAGDLAVATFPLAVCTCGDLSLASKLETSAYSSSGADIGGPIAGVGVNGSFHAIGDSDVDGDVVVQGDWRPTGAHEVKGDLGVGGSVEALGDVEIAGDAYVAGDFTGYVATVEGTLHAPASSRIGLGVSVGDLETTPVDIGAPCPCDGGGLLDVDGFIAAARTDNDNDVIGLTADALADIEGDRQLALPGGRYYVDAVGLEGALVLTVEGPVALFIEGDLETIGYVEVELATDDAELNLFVGGDLVGVGAVALGSPDFPGRVRTYLGGAGDVILVGDAELGGQLYAPHATLVALGDLEVKGAVLVGDVLDAGRVRVSYDVDVLAAGASCP